MNSEDVRILGTAIYLVIVLLVVLITARALMKNMKVEREYLRWNMNFRERMFLAKKINDEPRKSRTGDLGMNRLDL